MSELEQATKLLKESSPLRMTWFDGEERQRTVVPENGGGVRKMQHGTGIGDDGFGELDYRAEDEEDNYEENEDDQNEEEGWKKQQEEGVHGMGWWMEVAKWVPEEVVRRGRVWGRHGGEHASDEYQQHQQEHTMVESDMNQLMQRVGRLSKRMAQWEDDDGTEDNGAENSNDGNHRNGDKIKYQSMVQMGVCMQELVAMLEREFVGEYEKEKLEMLYKTCELYQKAYDKSKGKSAMVLFNWAVALTDIARIMSASDRLEAAEFVSAASMKYAASVSLDPGNAQALNNWGLVIRDLAELLPGGEESLLFLSLSRFRRALRVRHALSDLVLLSRCSYNLGTVLYQFVTSKNASSQSHDVLGVSPMHASQYIALAYAMNPKSTVFKRSLSSIHQFLPLPYLRYSVAYVISPSSEGTVEEEWILTGLALNAKSFQTVLLSSKDSKYRSLFSGGTPPNFHVDISQIGSIIPSRDPWFPTGWGFCMHIKDRRDGIYFVTESQEDMEGWIDALTLTMTLHHVGGEGIHILENLLLLRRPDT